MAKIGSSNPLPTQVGGSPSRYERTYAALKRLMGDHGVPEDEYEIDALWRQAKSRGLAFIGSYDEHAAMQAFPHTATDLIGDYEEVLGLPTDEEVPYELRRQEVVPRWVGVPESWSSRLEAQLQAIDGRASLLNIPWVQQSTTQAGRYYEPFSPVSGEEYDTFGSRRNTLYPNVSSACMAVVKFDIGNGIVPSAQVLRQAEQMKDLMNDILPGDVDFRIVYATGFYLDSSLLDATGFGT
jgi:hypothetical protein